MALRGERAYIPAETLPKKELEKVEFLETETDRLYVLRLQLADFFKRYRPYLPVEERAGKKHALTLAELSLRVQEGAQLDDLLPMDRIDAEIDQTPAPEKEKALLKKWRRTHLVGAVKRALRTQAELAAVGGEWKKEDPTAQERELQEFYRMRWKELGTAMRRLDELKDQAESDQELVDLAHSDPDFTPHPEDIDALENDYRKTFDEAQTLVSKSPEAYLAALGRQLQETKRVFDEHGRIVETPYVKAKLERIKELVGQGRPVFVHGELGTGKTELARHVARTELSDAHLRRWEAKNPPPRGDKESRKEWAAHREEQTEPLFVAGHRGIEIEEILAARAIRRAEAPLPESQVEQARAGWEAYKERLLDEARAGKHDVKAIERKLEAVDRPLYEQAMLESFRSPVETETVLGPLLQAMREGRPLIIDEVNAIPHHVLIVMNDLLMRQPGDAVRPPFPDAQPFKVKEGFAVIATGNYKPEDGLLYPGRQPLDAAFLSRFGIVSYDYLPMRHELEPPGLAPEQQGEFRQQNELYRMLVTRLLTDDLSVTLPENGFDKLRKLAYVASHIQDAFSERDVSEEWFANVRGAKVKPKDVLKENVLSIRHLLPILDRWAKDGFRRDVDDYLFLDYISRSDARKEEKLYLYQILKIQGDFFTTEKGWPEISERDEVLRFPIDQKIYAIDAKTGMRKVLPDRMVALKTFSPKDVIEELFGPAPKRAQLPKEYVERGRKQKAAGAVETTGEELERRRLLKSIEENIASIEEKSEGTITIREKK